MTPLILLTVPEAAAMLRVSPARLYSLVREGVLPPVRIGRQVRINPETIATFLAAGGHALKRRVDGV